MTKKDVHLYPKVGTSPKTRSVMNLEVTVDDYKPQALRKLRPYAIMSLHAPSTLPAEAIIVLQLLFTCFEKAKAVSEGLIGDMLWGFAQVQPPVPPELTLNGLKQLAKLGYVKFQAPDNTFVDLASDQASSAWIRYQPKLLDLVYEGEA